MTVHFIGAGPGAADLLTLRAVRLLETSAVCVYAGTYLDEAVLGHCPPGAALVDSQHLDLDAIIAHLVAAHGVGSVAEAAALGAAGPGSTLVLTRIKSAAVTCALASRPGRGGES